MRPTVWLWLLVACGVCFADDQETPVFRSDVALGRIDTLVMDRSQHPIGGLRKEDFLLRRGGMPVPIRNLAQEDLPVDVLLLLDVSGSMNIHIQKVAAAAHNALAVLGDQDRVGIMVFTTRTRVRLEFRANLDQVERRLDEVVATEPFNGGTNINGALLDAAEYVEHEGRPHVRHAVIIVTDDEAPACDQGRVLAALDRADAVLMVLLAPPYRGGIGGNPGGSGPGTGQPPYSSPWPGAQGPLGGVILGRRGPAGSPIPGRQRLPAGYPAGGISAGSPSIARASGGDSLNVHDASAVEATFERIRKRYAIYFYLPEGMEDGRGMEVELTDAARRRHPDAALQYRAVGLAKEGGPPELVTRVAAHPPTGHDPEPEIAEAEKVESTDVAPAPVRRRLRVSDSARGPTVVPLVQPGVKRPTDAETDPQVTGRRRGVSEPDGGPRVVIGPPQ